MKIGRRDFDWGSRTYLMGIINVTPDSFSDGGTFENADAAANAGEEMVQDGADIIDIGGESTRPGALPVSADEELQRVIPVIERLSQRIDAPISIDTSKAAVAREAIKAGATMVNDISGLRFDREMACVCAETGVAVCAMHMKGVPRTMQEQPIYEDVVEEVISSLRESIEIAQRAGVAKERIIIDPGLGFGKTLEHNLSILRNLERFKILGCPVLIGASRKSFIGRLTGLPVGERLPGSLAVLVSAAFKGADIVRVHDVADSLAASKIADAVARAG